MKTASDSSHLVLQVVSVGLVSLAAFSYGFVPIRACNDVWWHLKTGKLVIEAGYHLPANDVFTFTAEDIPWHNHEWLAQIVFYKIFQWGGGEAADLIGLRLLIAFIALATAATFGCVLFLVRQRCRCMPLAALIALLALDVSRYNLYPRPPIFTYLLMAIFLLVLSNWKSRKWPRAILLTLPPLMALWANLHGGFLVGLLIVGIYLAGEVIEYFFWKPESEQRTGGKSDEPKADFKSRLAWVSGTFAACLLASLGTPYHYHLYELPLRVMKSSALIKTIAEMRSPFAPDVAQHFIAFFVMAALIVIALAASRAVSRNRPPAADLLILLFFGYEAVRHQRHLPLFAIATAPTLGWATGQLLDRAGEQLRRNAGRLALAAITVLAGYWTGWPGVPERLPWRESPETYRNRNAYLASGVTYIEANFPKDVCDFILAQEIPGRMFNPINLAGYIIWRLSPEKHKLFTDNRFDIFGDRFVWDEFIVRIGIEQTDWDNIAWEKIGLTDREGERIREQCKSAGWSDILDRWKINFIVAEKSWPLCRKLSATQRWDRVYSWIKPPYVDSLDGYEIFVRRTDENRELISRCRRYSEQMLQLGRAPL